MAGTSVLKLKVDDKEYNSSLKQAQQGMQHLGQALKDAGKSFTQVDKSVVDYVRSIGQMEAQSKTARGRISEMSSAFIELSLQYKNMSDEVKSSDVGKALSESMEQLKNRTIDAKNELENLNNELNNVKMPEVKEGGGGLFSGLGDKMSGALQVFAGNMLTKAAGAVANLGSEMYDMVQQGIEMAKAGEGIRIAFERLGRGDILDGLREATHGTVTDLELMKAAVKFNDFKLPLDELGTMLAFAQQKAKDTGQSVDYMVDSIVTGLGRKSLMILDNLGLSATEVKKKMAETGDMTKAVGAIIREQMSKAGDYVETAADRAAQANVSLQNKMEELGRKFAPVEEASSQLWTSMKIGILDIIGGPLATLLNQLTEAGRLKNMLKDMNGEPGSGSTRVDQQLKKLNVIKKGGGSDYIFKSTLGGMIEDYNRQIMSLDTQIKNGGKRPGARSGESQDVRYLQQKMDALKIMRDQLAAGAKEINRPIKIEPKTVVGSGGGKTSTRGGSRAGVKEEKDDFEEIIGLIPNAQEAVRSLQQQISQSWDEGEIARLTADLKEAQEELQRLQNIGKETPMVQGLSGFNQETMSAWMQGRQGDLSKAEYGSPDYSSIMNNIADMNTLKSILEESVNKGIDTAQFNLSSLWEKIFDGENIPDEAWQNVVDRINEKLKDLGIEPIEIPIESTQEDIEAIVKSARTTAEVVGSIGDAFNAIEDPAAKVMGTVAQAVASVALSYAQAMVQAGSMGPWAWIAFAASGLATMISTISAIHSATGYAEGGIVGGTSYSGDNIPIMANAGELVLTKAQQNTLAQNLQSTGMGSMNLKTRVKGTELLVWLDNSLAQSGRGELVTWGT